MGRMSCLWSRTPFMMKRPLLLFRREHNTPSLVTQNILRNIKVPWRPRHMRSNQHHFHHHSRRRAPSAHQYRSNEFGAASVWKRPAFDRPHPRLSTRFGSTASSTNSLSSFFRRTSWESSHLSYMAVRFRRHSRLPHPVIVECGLEWLRVA
jgi:hypothetical protein